MKSTGILNAVKRSIAAVLLLIGIYMFVTATDLSKLYTTFRVNAGFASQMALLLSVGVVIVSIVVLFAAQYAGVSYFAAIAYLVFAVCCLAYYMSYSFYKDMIVFCVVFTAGAIAFYILAKQTPESKEPHGTEEKAED